MGTEKLPGEAGTAGWGGDTTGLKDTELKSLRSLGPSGLVPTVLEETERAGRPWRSPRGMWGTDGEGGGEKVGRTEGCGQALEGNENSKHLAKEDAYQGDQGHRRGGLGKGPRREW